MKNRKTELLAPAGKWDALRSAVQNGADAVYLGEKAFSARKNASNFTWEEISDAVKYCHLRDVKVHLAVNTLIADSELLGFENSVMRAADAGIDALIIQDLGAAHIARSVCPDMELHASTQLTACNEYDVNTLSEHGFSRIVLSRELSKEEIRRIRKNTDAELEAFVHGALCISFSGKCLMSSFIGGRSGNRGMCAQPCRQFYSSGSKKGYLLSPRDLCLADEVKAMYDAGITSFKIEGRMKSPEYVGIVTSVYRKYLDSFLPLEKCDEEKLEKIFVRGDGFTKAYFCEKNTPEIMNYSISNDNLSSRAGEDIIKEARASFRDGVENKKIPVSARLEILQDRPSSLTLSDGVNTTKASGTNGEMAKTRPLTFERAEAQIAKLGQTPFELRNFDFIADENVTIPVSSLNELRRSAAELLAEKRTQLKKKNTYSFSYPAPRPELSNKSPYISAEITTREQFAACKGADRILVPINLWHDITPDERCFVVLPQVVTDTDSLKAQLSDIPAKYGIYASSMGMLTLAGSMGHRVYADWSMNIYNRVTAHFLENCCDGLTLSPELSLSAVKDITSSTLLACEAVCYGYQRVMTSRACLIRGITGKCDCTENIKLRDKTGAQFVIMGNPETHICTVLNSRPTFMADKLPQLRSAALSGIRLCFTVENGAETSGVLTMYRGKTPAEKPPAFTRGYMLK